MKCPVCTDRDLQISERQGIEIDYCPNCRGVWLDRGELDKILDRTMQTLGGEEPAPAGPPRKAHGDKHADHVPHGKKRKHWLLELFD
jgi:Zn-finger nucleic acid-binding protein